MSIISALKSETREDAEYHNFDFKDRLGRVIGCYVRKATAEFVPVEEGVTCGWHLTPGVYFNLYYGATRNGEGYQSGNRKHFETEAAREKFIAKYVADARKRAAKREGK